MLSFNNISRRLFLFVFAFLLFAFFVTQIRAFDDSSSNIVINEFVPASSSADWIELYNNSDTDVNLGSWKIVITSADPDYEMNLSNNMTIPSKGFYVISLSDKLSNSSDTIQLFDNSNNLVSEIIYNITAIDSVVEGESLGSTTSFDKALARSVDGIWGDWFVDNTPTRGTNNDDSFNSITIQGGNNYETIQNAIDVIAQNRTNTDKKHVFIPDGTFTENLQLPNSSLSPVPSASNYSNIEVRGQSVNSVIIQSSNVYTVDILKDVNDFTLKDLTIKDYNDYSPNTYAVRAFNNTGLSLINVIVDGTNSANSTGVELQSSNNILFDNVTISNFKNDGIHILARTNASQQPTNSVTFKNVTVDSITQSNNDHAGLHITTKAGTGDVSGLKFEGSNTIKNSRLGVLSDGTGSIFTNGNEYLFLENIALTSNTYNIANFNSDNIYAYKVDFGTTDLNTIESTIIHDCVASPFEKGTCQGTDGESTEGNDLVSTFGSVNYIDTLPPQFTPEIGFDLATNVEAIASGYNGLGIASSTYRTCGGYLSDNEDLYRSIVTEAYDPTGVDHYEYQIRGGITIDESAVATNYSASFTPGIDYTDGIYYVRYRVTDIVGNSTVNDTIWSDDSTYAINIGSGIDGSWCKLIIDTKSPVVTDGPATNLGVISGTYSTEFEISDQGFGGNKVIGINISKGTITPVDPTSNSETRRFTWSLDTKTLADGVYTLDVCPLDIAGNVGNPFSTSIPTTSGSECFQITFEVDNTIPQATFGNLSKDEVINNLSALPAFPTVPLTSTEAIFNLSCSYPALTYPVDAESSQNPIKVVCTFDDEAGNTGSGNYFVTLLDVKPSVVIKLNPNSGILVGSAVSLTADTSANTKPGNQIVSYSWSGDCAGNLQTISKTPSEAKTYNCTVEVTDVDGDKASANISFGASNPPVTPEPPQPTTPQNKLPSVVIIANPSTNVSAGTTVTMQGNILSGDANFTYQYSGACSGSGTSAGGLVNTTTVPNTPGSYYCRIDITDANGDLAAAGATIVVNSNQQTTPQTQPQAQPQPVPDTPNVGSGEFEDENDIVDADDDEGEVLGEDPATSGAVDGECIPYAINGNVYVDKDKDNIRDQGEDEFLSGIKISIVPLSNTGVELESEDVITNSEGKWNSEMCNGRYRVKIDLADLEEGVIIKSSDSITIDINNGARSNIDFVLNEKTSGSWYLWLVIGLIVIGSVCLYLIAKRRRDRDEIIVNSQFGGMPNQPQMTNSLI